MQASAGLGNMVSDVCGIGLAGQIEVCWALLNVNWVKLDRCEYVSIAMLHTLSCCELCTARGGMHMSTGTSSQAEMGQVCSASHWSTAKAGQHQGWDAVHHFQFRLICAPADTSAYLLTGWCPGNEHA